MKFNLRPAVGLCILGFLMASCNDLFHDELSDCPQGVYVKFYSKNSCSEDTTYLGDTERIQKMHLFAFDDKGVLAGQTVVNKPELTKDKEFLLPLKSGKYELMAWVNAGENYDLAKSVVGVTTKNDLFLSQTKASSTAVKSLDGQKLWHGNSGRAMIVLPDAATHGSFYEHATVNLLEKTSRLNVSIELDQSVLRNDEYRGEPQDFIVEVKSNRHSSSYAGNADLKQTSYTYPAEFKYTENSANATFTLKDIHSDFEGILVLRNVKTNEVLWSGSLSGAILNQAAKKAEEKGEYFNFNCLNDFDIKFVIRDRCLNCKTYVCWAVLVEGWQVHSYSVALGD